MNLASAVILVSIFPRGEFAIHCAEMDATVRTLEQTRKQGYQLVNARR